ncbi:MAG: DNA repair protein [Crocinitomix sp.]|nr:DNA repair protein [Crocinitomix sp.]
MNVRLTQDQKVQLSESGDVYKIMQQILLRENKIGRNQEHFWVIGLDNQSIILFIELVGLGAVNRVGANPPDVFRMGIYKLAVGMILVHNHPSGNLKPSDEDIDFTDKMYKVGQIIGIEVIDHLIITEDSYTSLADKNVFDIIKKSGRYKVIDKDLDDYLEMKREIELDLKLKEGKIEIARKMKAKGMDADTIKEITGLTKWDIRKV